MEKTSRNKFFLFNWIFILGLIVLALNDHYLKWQFSNWLTGKISDFAGLLIFPMFLIFLFPKLIKSATMITGLFFIFWKLPVSESLISQYNKIAIVSITRTVDITDLVALSIIPFSHFFIKRIERFKIHNLAKLSLNPLIIIIPVSFVFMATSPPIRYYMHPEGDIHIGKSYRIKMTKEKVLENLNAAGFSVKLDTSLKQGFNMMQYYLIENVVLSGGKDTIKSIQFGFLEQGDKTLFLLKNIYFNGGRNISDWKELKRYSKYYRRLINSEIIEEIDK